MLIKFLLLVNFLCFFENVERNTENTTKIKAWIELEGKIQNLSIVARLQNETNKILTLDYNLRTIKEGRSGSSNTVQKGKCISPGRKIISLSESRMNLTKTDNLIIRLLVYHNDKLIAQDSVVLHGDNR